MPQLMPMFWVFSIFMVSFLLIMCCFLYFYKNNLIMLSMFEDFLFVSDFWKW